MRITGIICEYNPLHLGHKKQLDLIRATEPEGGIVCLMSGNYVQRGKPAIVDKSLRAKAALLCGADLVLELPITAALSSAEGFADRGVQILSGFCDQLCFGAETADLSKLTETAEALLQPEFSDILRAQLDKGLSFPAARQAALEQSHCVDAPLTNPNDILAVEYCKAILRQNSVMRPLPISRSGNYHADIPDPLNPSATSIRNLMEAGKPWQAYVPREAADYFEGAALHTFASGERAVLARLRCMEEAAFEALPYGSEGLWRKLMHAVREQRDLDAILTAVKSKRYTRTRLDRMVLCAFLGITQKMLQSPAPYVRVLGFNDRGRQILNLARKSGHFPNAGEQQASPYQEFENQCGDLYGLFAKDAPEAPGCETKRRVIYLP